MSWLEDGVCYKMGKILKCTHFCNELRILHQTQMLNFSVMEQRNLNLIFGYTETVVDVSKRFKRGQWNHVCATFSAKE